MLKSGQRFRMTGSPEVWRVLHVNESRAHCVGGKPVEVVIEGRTFIATSRRTLDISPNSVVDILTGPDPDEPVARPRRAAPAAQQTTDTAASAASVTGFVIAHNGNYLRRIQIGKHPGYRYDQVTKDRATVYKSQRGAQRSLDEYHAMGYPVKFTIEVA